MYPPPLGTRSQRSIQPSSSLFMTRDLESRSDEPESSHSGRQCQAAGAVPTLPQLRPRAYAGRGPGGDGDAGECQAYWTPHRRGFCARLMPSAAESTSAPLAHFGSQFASKEWTVSEKSGDEALYLCQSCGRQRFHSPQGKAVCPTCRSVKIRLMTEEEIAKKRPFLLRFWSGH